MVKRIELREELSQINFINNCRGVLLIVA